METRSAPTNTHHLFSDLSDVSSVSSCSEPGEDASEPAGRNPEGHDGRPVTVSNSGEGCTLGRPGLKRRAVTGPWNPELCGGREEQVLEEAATTCSRQQQDANGAGPSNQVHETLNNRVHVQTVLHHLLSSGKTSTCSAGVTTTFISTRR